MTPREAGWAGVRKGGRDDERCNNNSSERNTEKINPARRQRVESSRSAAETEAEAIIRSEEEWGRGTPAVWITTMKGHLRLVGHCKAV